jgi:hypothetical protein
MVVRPLQIESIERVRSDTFLLNFSDDTVAILTGLIHANERNDREHRHLFHH